MKIYVASSWRNERHPEIVEALRRSRFDVYDYRNPPGAQWSSTRRWWEVEGYVEPRFPEILNSKQRRLAFNTDMSALREANAVVLVLDSGKSAHLEAGFAAGAGKLLVVVGTPEHHPELMYGMAARCVTSTIDVLRALGALCALCGRAGASEATLLENVLACDHCVRERTVVQDCLRCRDLDDAEKDRCENCEGTRLVDGTGRPVVPAVSP